MPTRPALTVLACDAVLYQGQEAARGAGERELLPLDTGRVRAAVPARNAELT